MTVQELQLVITMLTAIGALIVAVAVLVWFIADQFKKNRAEFWRAISELHNTIAAQIDRHEQKDDVRFDRLTNQIWSIEVRNAHRDGEVVPPRPQNGNI